MLIVFLILNNMYLLVECQVFPCIDYVKKLIEYKNIKIESYESYQKMSFRNRYIISGANGLLNLTVPVMGGREQKSLIKEVRIDNSTNWKTRHWRSLLSAYNKAPYFEFYAEDIKNLIFSREELLFSFNIKILDWLCKALEINAVIGFTEAYIAQYSTETDYRNYFLPKSFQKDAGNWVPHYSQVFEERIGFQPNLSIIDLILCEGPNAIYLLNHSKSRS